LVLSSAVFCPLPLASANTVFCSSVWTTSIADIYIYRTWYNRPEVAAVQGT
jgi:hypothetical protein